MVGIGDMSGDVFGNGLLLSDEALLIGAFNHRHILSTQPQTLLNRLPSASACSTYPFELVRL